MASRFRNLLRLTLCILALASAIQIWPRNSTLPRSLIRFGNLHSTADDLVARGKERYKAYKCYECHGQNGEGTDEGVDLRASHLTADEVERTLKRPSADADAKGMPAIPADSPDLKPLVAFVLSLRPPPPK